MANIYLLIDYSISNAWLAASIHANQGILAANGIDLVPFDSANTDFVPRNLSFWYASASEPLPPALMKKLAVVKKSLKKGRDVFFLGQSVDLNVQKNFFAFIRKYLHTETHTVIPLMIMGKPTLSMEFWWQGTPQGVDNTLADKYINYARNSSQLLLQVQAEWGKENLILIPDLHDTITANGVAEISRQVFKALGIDDAPCIPAPLPFYCFINTATAVRLLEARQVRQNDWPRLDNTAYMSALQKLDQGWGPEPVSPLTYRQMLLEKGQEDQKELEIILGLPARALDAPGWYGDLPATDASTPLKSERIKAFAETLAHSVRTPLLQRFANDYELLSKDQESLAQALARAEEGDFTRIGETREQPLLTVLTMTRNHEKYIGQCIEGVLAQKTNFPVRHLVLDHYSTDGTAQIVNTYAREHPSIRPVLLNSYHQFYNNVRDLFIRCHSEYAAICDGDDYFTDPAKLQKQMDFLNKHPKCSLCFHPVEVTFEDGQPSWVYPPPENLPRGVHEEYYLADLFKGNMIQTNSVLYRWRFRDGLPEWFRDDLCPGDWYWHILHAEQGKIGFLPDVMSVYRRHGNSLYKYAFINRVEHRRMSGMAELEAYNAINEHFRGRYFLPLAKFAAGILSDFLEIYTKENDSQLLDQACETYPEFTRYFLNVIRLEKGNLPSVGREKLQ